MIKVENMKSNKCNKVANQFIITDSDHGIEVFQSYESIIASVEGEEIILDVNKWDYSKTTMRYLCDFLAMFTKWDNLNKKNILKLIKSGEIKIENLNV